MERWKRGKLGRLSYICCTTLSIVLLILNVYAANIGQSSCLCFQLFIHSRVVLLVYMPALFTILSGSFPTGIQLEQKFLTLKVLSRHSVFCTLPHPFCDTPMHTPHLLSDLITFNLLSNGQINFRRLQFSGYTRNTCTRKIAYWQFQKETTIVCVQL